MRQRSGHPVFFVLIWKYKREGLSPLRAPPPPTYTSTSAVLTMPRFARFALLLVLALGQFADASPLAEKRKSVSVVSTSTISALTIYGQVRCARNRKA